MLGWVAPTDIAAQMQAADLVVVPSGWEGFGLAAAEAIRAGKPVIASNVGGLRELVTEGVNGRLVPPDSPDALRAALMTDSLQMLKAMGEAGHRIYLQRFTAARMNQSLLGIYSQLFRARHPAAASADLQVARASLHSVRRFLDPGLQAQRILETVAELWDLDAGPRNVRPKLVSHAARNVASASRH